MIVQQEEPCDICGNIGVEDAISSCSQCKIAREHIYCMQTYQIEIPRVWLCEECGLNNQTALFVSGVKEDLTKPPMLKNSSGGVHNDNVHLAGAGKLPNDLRRGCINWEKKVETGKVKYLPAQEAIKLSSGTKKSESPSKINFRLNSGSSKRPATTSLRTPDKPNVLKSLLIIKSTPSFVPSGDLNPRRLGNAQINPMVRQQFMKSPKVQKGKVDIPATAKEHVYQGQPVNGLKFTLESASTGTKAETVPIKLPCASSRLFLCPPSISGGNDSINVELRKSDAGSANLMKNLPCDPALDASWMGSFKILDNRKYKELNDGIQAHPPSRVRRRIYEFSKQMPKNIQFEFIPRCNLWMRLFQDDCPDQNDIGLYFFPSDIKRSENYISLLEFICMQDLVMRSRMEGVELLVLTSKLLDSDSQRWNGNYFLWGVFHALDKALHKDEEEHSLLVSPSSDKCDNLCRGDDMEVVDMEIDMLGGQNVGRIDVKIPKQSPNSCHGEEFATSFTWHVPDARAPVFSRNSNLSIQQSFSDTKSILHGDIPPGFEETYRLRLKEDECRATLRKESTRLFDGRATGQTKENLYPERVSEFRSQKPRENTNSLGDTVKVKTEVL